jgi:Xaa-Pro aminopeptidase
MTPEIQIKLEKVRGLLDRLALDAVLLRKQSNFAWATAGARNYVSIASEVGAASILITRERQYVLCNAIEAPRLASEEKVEDLGYAIHSFPWYQDREAALARELVGRGGIGCDVPFADFRVVGGDISPLRWSLTPWEIERYRELGFMTARAIEDAARAVRPGDKECAVVGKLAACLWENRLDYITIFCAADERISRLRHPIATDARVDKRAMLSVNARKWGLIVSLTRFVQFGPVPAEIRRRYDANVRVDCAMMAATVPGRPAREVFDTAIAAYAAEGFPGEHELHHQGGSIGYEGRDYKVTFDTPYVVQENQGFTWNPSITGAKSEDTILATGHGPEMLSPPVTFPTLDLTVGGHRFRRPDILTL